MKQTIRIIGGQYRGKKIHFPSIEHLRPTPDRVRETLFNWLMHDIQQARCLDAFAGSGALGFEAVSRGAKQVVMIEQATAVVANLKQIAKTFPTTALSIVEGDARQYLQTTQDIFDIIFFDPPFTKPQLLEVIPFLSSSPVLRLDGLLYLETPAEIPLATESWEKVKLKHAGQVTYALYRKVG